jgi:nucleoside-diphosphate-sugar epimerase
MASPSDNSIHDVEQLEELLSAPTEGVIETMRRLSGDVMVLGVAGKMGPTLARMIRRASDAAGIRRRVIGASRFSTPGLQQQLERQDIETIQCDLLDRRQLECLPDVPNIVYMAGMKFGSTGNQALTWAMNCYLPGVVCERFTQSRIVAFSTGNVYGLTPVKGGGSVETDAPNPVGEYAMSCLGRERIFEHFGRALTIPIVLIRLNYAVELRYGVLLDIARRVVADEPIDLAMGHFNVIWQGDANAMTLAAFDLVESPAIVLNVTGPEILRVRDVAEELGKLLGKSPRFVGTEAADALLANSQIAQRVFGSPTVGAEQVIRWVADWVKRSGPTLEKPTHFEARDGKY